MEHTVAYKLFHTPILVDIKNMFYYKGGRNGHMSKVLGFASGNDDKDREFMHDYTTISLTPIGIILLYDKGIPVHFRQVEDMINVYQWLKKHLENWSNQIRQPFGLPPPKEDLMIMDRYAEHLSIHAEEAIERIAFLTKKPVQSDTFDIFSAYDSPLRVKRAVSDIPENLGYQSPLTDTVELMPWDL